jgi:oligopeptide transport system permease protein
MLKFIFRRLMQSIPVLLIIITLTFFLVRLAPGDPFSSERAVSPQIREKMMAQYGLNDPLPMQYVRYLGNLAQGDLGPSFKHEGRTVNEMIGESIGVSFELGTWALLLALGLGVPAGIIAALRKNTWLDYVPMTSSMIGICLPTLVVGPILQLVLGLMLGDWMQNSLGTRLPVSGWSFWSDENFQWQHRVLPAMTLGLAYAAYIARLTRAGMLEVLSSDFIRTARAKGVPEWQVVLRHSLRGGLLPVVTFLGPALASLLSGAFITEMIFQIPGLGRHFVNAALNRDYTMVLGTVTLFATLILIANLLVDVVQVLMNPRLRFE